MKLYPSFRMAIGFCVSCKTCARQDNGACKYYYETQNYFNVDPNPFSANSSRVRERDVEYLNPKELSNWSCPNWVPDYKKVVALIEAAYDKTVQKWRSNNK